MAAVSTISLLSIGGVLGRGGLGFLFFEGYRRDRAVDETGQVVNRMRDEGVLIGTEGPAQNVLKIRPPMPFDATDADTLIRTLDRILSEFT